MERKRVMLMGKPVTRPSLNVYPAPSMVGSFQLLRKDNETPHFIA